MGIWLVMQMDGGERPFRIRKPRTIIGREPASDVRIAVPSVALRHCELTLRDDELRLVDLGSDRGTLHNGNPVHEAVLADTDELTVGPVTFHVRRTAEDDQWPEPKLETRNGIGPQIETTQRSANPTPGSE